MKNKKAKFFSLLMALLMVLSILPTGVLAAESDWTSQIASKTEGSFRLGVVSDSHIGTGSTKAKNLDVALNAFDSLGVDAVAMNGDMVYAPAETDTENTKYVYNESEVGLPGELYGALKGFISQNGSYTLAGTQSGDVFTADTQDGKKPIIYSMGNHEFPLNGRSETIEAASKQLFTEQTGRAPSHVMNVGGYTFIVGEPENYDLDYTAAEEFVKAQILAAESADPSNKPIFYLQHEAVYKTVTESLSSASDNTESFKAFLNEHPRVIVLSGHTHAIIEDPRNIWQDGFTAIATSQLGGGSVSGGSTSYSMGTNSAGSQAIMIDLAEKENKTDVSVYRMNLLTGKVIGAPYTFTIDGTTDTFKYNQSRYDNPSIANFKAGSSLTINNDARQGFKFTYNVGDVEIAESSDVSDLQDAFVLNYRVVLENTDANVKVQNFRVFSDIFEAESDRVSSYSITFENQLDRNTNYKLSVYALTPFTADLSVSALEAKGVTPVTYSFKTSSELTASDKSLIRTHEGINVALNKNVSSGNPNHNSTALKKLVNGSYSDFVHADDGENTNGTYVSGTVTLPSGVTVNSASGQKDDWFIVDLGRRYQISKVKVWPRVSGFNAVQMRYFDIEASNTEDFASNVTLASVGAEGVADSSTPVVCDGDGGAYRYIRIRKTGNTSYSFGELEVFADIKTQEVSRNRQVSANYYTPSSFKPSYTVDGVTTNANQCWLVSETGKSDDIGAPYNLVVDLERDYPVGMIEMFSRHNSAASVYRSNWNIYGYTNEQGNPGADRDSYSDGTLLWKVGSTGYDASGLKAMINGNGKYRYIVFSKFEHQILAVGEIRAEVVMPKVVGASRENDKTINVSFTEKMNIASLEAEDAVTVTAENGTVYTPSAISLTGDGTWDGGYDAVLTFEESLPSAGLILNIDGNAKTTDGATLVEDAKVSVSGKELAINKAYKKAFENVNVALNKPVIAGKYDRTDAYKLTDGSKAAANYISGSSSFESGTITLPDGTNVAAATGNKNDWFIVDLGRRYKISEIKLYPKQSSPAQPNMYAFNIEGANEVSATTWKKLGGLANDDANAPADTSPYVTKGDGNAYRYIRIRKTAGTHHIYSELEVYADITATNVAIGADAVARASYSTFTGNKTVDGTINYASNGWRVTTAPGADKTPNNLVIDLGAEYPLEIVEIHSNSTGAIYNKNITAYGYSAASGKPDVTTDNSGATKTLFSTGNGVSGGYQKFHFDKGNYQYLVISKTKNEVVWLTEVQAYTVNPEAYDVAVNDDTITVKFTDKMEVSTLVADNFEIDGVTLSNPRVEAGYDMGYEVTFNYSGKIVNGAKLTISDKVRNQNGIEMAESKELTLNTDTFTVVQNGVEVKKFTKDVACDIEASLVSPVSGQVKLFVAVKNGSKLVSCALSEQVTATEGVVLTASVTGVTPKSGEKLYIYLWDAEKFIPIVENIIVTE